MLLLCTLDYSVIQLGLAAPHLVHIRGGCCLALRVPKVIDQSLWLRERGLLALLATTRLCSWHHSALQPKRLVSAQGPDGLNAMCLW